MSIGREMIDGFKDLADKLEKSGGAPVEMPESFDPYHDSKVYHLAKLIHKNTGAVSPLCAKKPRRLNLNRELWTNRREAVTCKKCLKLMADTPPPRA